MVPRLPPLFPISFALCWALCLPCAAEPSLANLLGASATTDDPTAQALERLASELAALERRPFAEDAAVRRAVAEARSELSRVRSAYAAGASEQTVQRGLGLLRAIMLAADRLEARVAAAAALSGLKVRAQATQDAARGAQASPPASEQKP